MTEAAARRRIGMPREETLTTIEEQRMQLALLNAELKAANNRIQRLEMDLFALKDAIRTSPLAELRGAVGRISASENKR